MPALCRGLVRAGAEVTVVTTTANGEAELDVPLGLGVGVDRGGVRVFYFRRGRPKGFYRARGLAAACTKLARSHDVVHITGLWAHPGMAAAAAARRAGVPYIISPRGMLMPWALGYHGWKKRPVYLLSERRRLRAAAAIHCTGEDERVAVHALGLGATAFVVPNGLDPAEFERLPPRETARRMLGIPGDARVVLFLGRLHRKKGIERTLEAFAIVAETRPDVHLLMAGPSEQGYHGLIGAWAREHRLADRIQLPGELRGERRLAALAAADVFVLLSQSENFGMGVAEAMACGVPVVVTPGVGIAKAVERTGAGVVVDGGPRQAAEALASLLGDEQRRRAMGAKGRGLLQTEFSVDAVSREMLGWYEEIVSGG